MAAEAGVEEGGDYPDVLGDVLKDNQGKRKDHHSKQPGEPVLL